MGIPGMHDQYTAKLLSDARATPPAISGGDSQFKDGNFREFDAIFFDLGCGMGWTEIPLLAHYLSQCAFPVRRPSQHKFLRPACFFFLKNERDAFNSLWPIKDQPDQMSPRLSRTPAFGFSCNQRGLDRMIFLFRCAVSCAISKAIL